jgi:hypothetical protein
VEEEDAVLDLGPAPSLMERRSPFPSPSFAQVAQVTPLDSREGMVRGASPVTGMQVRMTGQVRASSREEQAGVSVRVVKGMALH